jgi:hypothetical protein
MSELPNFKEGFIFDITKEDSIVITALNPCLFKIASLDYYSKHYSSWSAQIDISMIDNEENLDYTNTLNIPQHEIPIYNDLSFILDKPPIMIWEDGIYCCGYSGDLFNNLRCDINLTRHEDLDGDTTSQSLDSINFAFECRFTSPTVSYIDNEVLLANNGYGITLNNPVTTINWAYDAGELGDELKYYHFLLYNIYNKCVVDTGKVYTNIPIGFVCNSLDDNSTYTLVGYCVSQNGQKVDLPDLTITTKYTTGRIYSNLIVDVDKYSANNKITAEVVNLVGRTTNKDVVFIDGEKIDLKTNDNAVIFTDIYNLLTDKFLIRLWINGIKNNKRVTVLKFNNPLTLDNIEVYYEDGYFYAIKNVYGLTSRYMSNVVNKNDVLNGNIYLSILYYNGRIDIYATSYAESEAIAL